MVAHPGSVHGDIALSSYFGLIRFTVLEILRSLHFGIFCLKLPVHAHSLGEGVWGIFSHMKSSIVIIAKRHLLVRAERRRSFFSLQAWKSVQRFDLGTCSRKRDKAGQDGTVKSHEGVIFHLLGDKPQLNRFAPKFVQ